MYFFSKYFIYNAINDGLLRQTLDRPLRPDTCLHSFYELKTLPPASLISAEFQRTTSYLGHAVDDVWGAHAASSSHTVALRSCLGVSFRRPAAEARAAFLPLSKPRRHFTLFTKSSYSHMSLHGRSLIKNDAYFCAYSFLISWWSAWCRFFSDKRVFCNFYRRSWSADFFGSSLPAHAKFNIIILDREMLPAMSLFIFESIMPLGSPRDARLEWPRKMYGWYK